MAFDEGLAQRLREALSSHQGIAEKKMFDGLAFMSRGYMFLGIVGDVLMARVGPEHYEEETSPNPPQPTHTNPSGQRRPSTYSRHAASSGKLSRPHVRAMDFTGKPMTGYVFVDPTGFENDSDLLDWVQRCHRFVQSLPPKKPKRPSLPSARTDLDSRNSSARPLRWHRHPIATHEPSRLGKRASERGRDPAGPIDPRGGS